MSVEAIAKANKRAALEQLRFSKVKKQKGPSLSAQFASSSSSSAQIQSQFTAPPLQSRDGTVASRYFPTSTPSLGTVLVPSSSPTRSGLNDCPQQPRQPPSDDDVAAAPDVGLAAFWGHSNRTANHDLLSAPSGFTSRPSAHDVSFAGLKSLGDKPAPHVPGASEHSSPPGWHRHDRHSSDPLDLFVQSSPGSPAVQRMGQRRRAGTELSVLSNSSEESLPDVGVAFAASSKPRIMRGRRPDSQETSPTDTPHTDTEDPRFTRFKVTMPEHAPSLILAAWKQADGDIKQATSLLSQPAWVQAEATGRVKEVDEATRAMRAAEKEKGKRSMIYANRISGPTLSSPIPSSPPSSVTRIDLTDSPLSPAVGPRTRKTRVVAESDSEPEIVGRKQAPSSIPVSIPKQNDRRVLDHFNTKDAEALQELTGCTTEQASAIISLRPFESVTDLKVKLGQGKKKTGPAGISPRMIEDCLAIFEGYNMVDSILEECEEIGSAIRAAIAKWTPKESSKLVTADAEEGALSIVTADLPKNAKSEDYIETEPALLDANVRLKDYQLLGVNWLQLLYRRELSCILADEMGLGKTIQVISFFALLKERGNVGPHLVVVPSSTLENWCREFARFAPSISIQTYYAGKEERPQLRQTLLDTRSSKLANGKGWEVLVTTYALAQGDGFDRKFFRRVEWDTCVFDEGHVLKNFQSQRYQALLKFPSKWRLLLTGTPLQNNLQELVSLMNFILPSQFADSLTSLRAIFKVKGDAKVTLLAQDRVSRAKKMMTPFVLRRRKDQVLKDLPKKTERIEWCDMTSLQKSIYNDALRRSRKVIMEGDTCAGPTPPEATASNPPKQIRAQKQSDKKYLENSTNVLMDLRKAALHPMLFRTLFTDRILTGMAKQLMKESDFRKRQAVFQYVKEDMEVMTDAELQVFCRSYKSIHKFLRGDECYLDAGKVNALLRFLKQFGEEGRKVLIFSQFTQVLDILQSVLKQKKYKFLVLTGSTPVDIRQALVDEFTEDDSIHVFLLSTKAGGMGINLTAASVVIMFDQDFNPHNDRQAQDRAYRIGQKRDVEVIKLITRGTIEEDMLKLGQTKLALDEAVAGDNEDAEGNAREAEVRRSLMNTLRRKLTLQETDQDVEVEDIPS